jgi:hypothetical protein
MKEIELPTKVQREVLHEVVEIERTIQVLVGSILYMDMPLKEVRKE